MLVNFASASDGLKYTESCQEKKNVCVIVLTYTQRSQRMQADTKRRETEWRQKLAYVQRSQCNKIFHI